MKNTEQTRNKTRNRHEIWKCLGLFLLLPTAYCLLTVFTGCSKKSGQVLARVGSEKITVEEFEKLLANESYALRDYLSTEVGQRQYLDALVKEKVALVAARKQGIHKRPDIKKQLSELEKRLEENYRRMKDKILTDAIIEQKIALGDSDVEKYYEEHKEEFENPTELKVSHILLGSRGDAENVLARIKKGESFSKLAKEVSIDKMTASKGGDLGFFGRREYVKEFEDAAFKLKKNGDISDVVETPLGYHIIKLVDKRRLKAQKMEDVEMQIRRVLQKEKVDKWMEDASEKYKPKINEKLFETIAKGPSRQIAEQEKK
ncbi:MAG: peptidylprolyl isomerase [Elusimicrobia bacterium]|nr:peptidylprolyl isomerase [Elusimicrobiota bacterium]